MIKFSKYLIEIANVHDPDHPHESELMVPIGHEDHLSHYHNAVVNFFHHSNAAHENPDDSVRRGQMASKHLLNVQYHFLQSEKKLANEMEYRGQDESSSLQERAHHLMRIGSVLRNLRETHAGVLKGIHERSRAPQYLFVSHYDPPHGYETGEGADHDYASLTMPLFRHAIKSYKEGFEDQSSHKNKKYAWLGGKTISETPEHKLKSIVNYHLRHAKQVSDIHRESEGIQ
jgi:hypothetical protein